jgi:hypothetical protein
VDGDKPKVSDSRFQDGIDILAAVKPIDEGLHFVRKQRGLGGFVVNPLVSDRTGDDLHRPRIVASPSANHDLGHAAASCRKQRSMPAK